MFCIPKIVRAAVVLGFVTACSPVVERPPPTTQPTPEAKPELTPEITVDHRPILAERIAAAGYEGVFVILDPGNNELIVSDPELAERQFIPASTFKIPNSLIALETGVAESPAFMLKWDGVQRGGASWDRDHDMRSAFAESAVWYYQELARRIGEQRMAQWIVAADYGNADISGGVDMFWLNGGLRISPREQVEFLQHVHTGASPFASTTIERFLDEVMVEGLGEGNAGIRAKTGWARAQDFVDPTTAGFEGHLGWFVGSVERPGRERVYFATLLLAPNPAPDSFSDDRQALTRAVLRELGYLH
jgi:beta-lactamase class D